MATPDPFEDFQFPISDQAAYLARVHVGVTVPLLALCLVPFCARLYVRVRPVWRLAWDDFFIILGLMLAVADWALLQSEMFLTPQILSFPVMTYAMELSYLAIPVWGGAMTCIKISVALSLLRIPVNRLWSGFLYTVTAFQVAYFIGNTVYIFVACRPLKAIWDFSVTDGYCLGPETSRIASNVGSAINITTDVLLSLAPMVMLWNLHRPLRERILVCCLMGIGLLASVSCIVKAVTVRRWGTADIDTWALAMSIATWTMIEELLAVLAACSPSLKGPLERFLRRIGISIVEYNSQLSFVPERWLEGRGGRRGRRDPEMDPEMDPELKFPGPAHLHDGVASEKTGSTSSASGPIREHSSVGLAEATAEQTSSREQAARPGPGC